MTAKNVLLRPQGLPSRARALTCPPCYATGPQIPRIVSLLLPTAVAFVEYVSSIEHILYYFEK